MAVGFFHIAIEILHRTSLFGQPCGQMDGNGGFSRAAFAAGNGNDGGRFHRAQVKVAELLFNTATS